MTLTQRLFQKAEDPEDSDVFSWFALYIELLCARHFQMFPDPKFVLGAPSDSSWVPV